jgi:hypothetical protein
MRRARIAGFVGLCAACGGSSGDGATTMGGATTSSSTTTAEPCGPGGLYGTFTAEGTLAGTEILCGVALGSFAGAKLTIAHGAGGAGATVTLAGSADGHIDVTACAATVTNCTVKAEGCQGAKDGSTVSLEMEVSGSTLTGTSHLDVNGCGAPGLSFTAKR